MAEKFGIISSLDPIKKGDQFEQFPLHVTLMTWFDMPQERAFINKLQNFAHEYGPQTVEGGDEAMFGVNADVRVRKLGRAGSLYAMHDDLHKMITDLGGEIWYGGFVKSDYLPHVTFQGDRGIEAGEQCILDRFQLIRGDETGPRTVVADLGFLKGRE